MQFMTANNSFVDSHRSRALFIAAILFMVVTAINLTVGVANHKNLMLVAGVCSFVAGVLFFISAKRPSA
jgi:hypothetical protein